MGLSGAGVPSRLWIGRPNLINLVEGALCLFHAHETSLYSASRGTGDLFSLSRIPSP